MALEKVEYVDPEKMLSIVQDGCGMPRAKASSELGKCVVAYTCCEQKDMSRAIPVESTYIICLNQGRPPCRNGGMAVNTECAPIHPPAFFELGPVRWWLQGGSNAVAPGFVIEAVEAHHTN